MCVGGASEHLPPPPASPFRLSSASFRGRSPGVTPAGEPRMSGSAFLLPERPEEAKSSTGSTSVISGALRDGPEEQTSISRQRGGRVCLVSAGDRQEHILRRRRYGDSAGRSTPGR